MTVLFWAVIFWRSGYLALISFMISFLNIKRYNENALATLEKFGARLTYFD